MYLWIPFGAVATPIPPPIHPISPISHCHWLHSHRPNIILSFNHFHFCQLLLLFISRNIHEVFRDSFSSSQPLPEGRASTAWSTWQATTTTLNNTTNKLHKKNRQTTTLSPQGGLASFVRCLLHQRLFKTEGNRKPMVATVYLHSG